MDGELADDDGLFQPKEISEGRWCGEVGGICPRELDGALIGRTFSSCLMRLHSPCTSFLLPRYSRALVTGWRAF